jgi:hypothetical protein
MYLSFPQNQFFDADGKPLVGRVTFYVHDSDTEADVYTLTGTTYTQASNPQFLTEAGTLENSIFFKASIVDVLLEKYVGSSSMESDNDPSSWESVATYSYGLDVTTAEETPTVTTINALKALSVDYGKALVTGYYAEGDSPARFYVWDASATDTSDGGYVIPSDNTSSGRWILLNEGDTIDCRCYGVDASHTANLPSLLNYKATVGSQSFKTAAKIRFTPETYATGLSFTTSKIVVLPKNFVYADTLTCPIAELDPDGSAFANFVFTGLGVIVRKDAFYDANAISSSNALGYIESGKLTLLKSLTVNGVNISATGTLSLGGTLSATVGNFGSLYASTLFQVGKSGETKSAVIYGTLTVSSTINGVDLGASTVSSGNANLAYSAAGTSVIGTFSVPAGKILEVIVRHDVTRSNGQGSSKNSVMLLDTDNEGDRVEWYFSGTSGLKETETLIVQNTTSSVKTYTLSEYVGMNDVTAIEDNVTYRSVIRSL